VQQGKGEQVGAAECQQQFHVLGLQTSHQHAGAGYEYRYEKQDKEDQHRMAGKAA
jgi:hypothetical protein